MVQVVVLVVRVVRVVLLLLVLVVVAASAPTQLPNKTIIIIKQFRFEFLARYPIPHLTPNSPSPAPPCPSPPCLLPA